MVGLDTRLCKSQSPLFPTHGATGQKDTSTHRPFWMPVDVHSMTVEVAPRSAMPASSFWDARLSGVERPTEYFPLYGQMAKGALQSLQVSHSDSVMCRDDTMQS